VRAGPVAALVVAGLLAACGDDSGGELESGDRGAGVGALGGSAETQTLARTRLERRPPGALAWVAHEVRLAPGQAIEHKHELAFVYGRRGEHEVRRTGDAPLDSGGDATAGADATPEDGDGAAAGAGAPLAGGDGAAVSAGALHRHLAGDDGSVFWEIRVAPRGAPAPPGTRGARRVFESEPLEGVPAPAAVSLIEVTVPPRGGRTTVHTHPGPEFIYQLTGRIDYQNAIVGTKRLGPGGAEGIPPDTAVQKRNPYADPASFLSMFLVDPDRPFAPKAGF
jgi:hypothetical protein